MGMPTQPIPFRMNDANLRRLIAETAADSKRIVLLPHAREKMAERHITMRQVIDCLLHGVVSQPAFMNIKGNWQCTLMRRNAGDEVCVVAALEQRGNGDWVAVITTF